MIPFPVNRIANLQKILILGNINCFGLGSKVKFLVRSLMQKDLVHALHVYILNHSWDSFAVVLPYGIFELIVCLDMQEVCISRRFRSQFEIDA